MKGNNSFSSLLFISLFYYIYLLIDSSSRLLQFVEASGVNNGDTRDLKTCLGKVEVF